MNRLSPDYRGYRFPPEVIGHAVWLYHRFSLSLRNVEDLLLGRHLLRTAHHRLLRFTAFTEWAAPTRAW